MMGNESIDVGLGNIWRSWFHFRKEKRKTEELHYFEYFLEKNLYSLFQDLNLGRYRHGGYRKFMVRDNKQREISVASVRDRVVHRLVYEYLAGMYDKTFLFDTWSCRLGKGLFGAIRRIQSYLRRYPRSSVWKSDVKKFFDNVDHQVLIQILSRKLKDQKTLDLITEIISSFHTHTHTP